MTPHQHYLRGHFLVRSEREVYDRYGFCVERPSPVYQTGGWSAVADPVARELEVQDSRGYIQIYDLATGVRMRNA